MNNRTTEHLKSLATFLVIYFDHTVDIITDKPMVILLKLVAVVICICYVSVYKCYRIQAYAFH